MGRGNWKPLWWRCLSPLEKTSMRADLAMLISGLSLGVAIILYLITAE